MAHARRPLVPSVLSLAVALSLPAQAVTTLVGDPAGPVSVRVVQAATGADAELVAGVLLRPLDHTARVEGEARQTDRLRRVPAHGTHRLEWPDGARLYAFERTIGSGHGLLYVPPSGQARVVLEQPGQLDGLMAAAHDGRHVAFARNQEVVVVRLQGAPFADTGTWVRTVPLPSPAVAESLVCGANHLFFVTDDDRVHRLDLATGQRTDLTPAGTGSPRQSEYLAIASDADVVAFLRSEHTDQYAVWVAGGQGPARRLSLPDANYREPSYLPEGDGQPHLLLDATGSRLMVTEVRLEDELHVVDTGIGGTAVQITRDEMFADYIGTHILPSFVAGKLVFASGHQGWKDWYAVDALGGVANLSLTGSPEPTFLVGALDVRERYSLGSGQLLATESIGTFERLRRLDPNGGSTVLFADLLAAPEPGAATHGAVDLRVVGAGGERLLRGSDGTTLVAAPPGISLSTPVRGPQGWTIVEASFGGVAFLPVVVFADGSLLPLWLNASPTQWVWTAAGDLAAVGNGSLLVVGANGVVTAPLPAGPHRLLSGAGG